MEQLERPLDLVGAVSRHPAARPIDAAPVQTHWPAQGSIVATAQFEPDPENGAEKGYAGVVVLRQTTLVFQVTCLACGCTGFDTAAREAFSAPAPVKSALDDWASRWVSDHDAVPCRSTYTDHTTPISDHVVREIETCFPSGSDGWYHLQETIDRCAADTDGGSWLIVATQGASVGTFDVQMAHVALTYQAESPHLVEHDERLTTIADLARSADPFLCVSSDGYEIAPGARRWTLVRHDHLLTFETRVQPGGTVEFTTGSDVYGQPGGRQFITTQGVTLAAGLCALPSFGPPIVSGSTAPTST